MKFITICDRGSVKVSNLFKSLNGNLTFIDYDQSMGNLSKIFKFYDFLITSTIPHDEIIVYTDAYDVICAKLEGLEEAFRSTKKDIIYGSELFNIHQRNDVRQWFRITFADRPFRSINCGFCIGYYHSFIKMLSHIVENFDQIYKNDTDSHSEQKVISHFMMKNAKELHIVNIDIDSNAVFCTTVSSSLSKTEDIQSYFIHVPWLANPMQNAKYEKVVAKFLRP